MVAVAPTRWLPVHVQVPRLYAGFWRRVLAWIIDVVILAAINWVLLLFFGAWLLVPWMFMGGWHANVSTHVFHDGPQPYGLLLTWLYYALCEASPWQATPGKLALGLAVTDVQGQRIGFPRATGRFFGKIVSALILCIGFLLAGWTARKQALHDFMAGCCVVRKDGLAAWQREQTPSAEPAAAASASYPYHTAGLPGWAIALIVLAACIFLVLPIAGIFAAFAIPAYQSYTVRSEVEQGLAQTRHTRALIAEYIGTRGALPADNHALGLPKPDAIHARYVSSVRVDGGKVVVTYGNQASADIKGGHVVMSPMGNAAKLNWQCSSPDIRDDYLPDSCRE
ncbi:MAG TPA: RDD family protein [Rhodanobacteraceae bacterium]